MFIRSRYWLTKKTISLPVSQRVARVEVSSRQRLCKQCKFLDRAENNNNNNPNKQTKTTTKTNNNNNNKKPTSPTLMAEFFFSVSGSGLLQENGCSS